MQNWRDEKRAALADIHATFALPAVYLSRVEGTPVAVDVRLHQRASSLVQQNDDWTNAGQMVDQVDRIGIDESAFGTALLRNVFFIFGPTEAYRTGSALPARDGYIWVEVADVKQPELTAMLAGIDTTVPPWTRLPAWSQP